MSQPFRKFKLVPVEKNELQAVEENLRNYDPTLRAMANAYLGGHHALNSRLPAKTRLQLMTANRSRFQQLMHQKLNEQHRIPTAYLAPPAAMPAPVPVPAPIQPQPITKPEVDVKTGYRPNVAIPKRYASKYENLLKLTSDTIGVGSNGTVVIRGHEVKSSSYGDIMRSLFSDAKGKAVVPGLSETIGELKRLNIPSSMITSPRARAIYQSVDQGGSGKCRYNKSRMLRLY